MTRLLRSRTRCRVLAAVLSLAASACGEKEPPIILPEKPISSGFEVDANAFPFPNYGGVRPDGDLTSSEVTRMFGRDGVCADTEANCRLTPIAREFATNANASMQGGRCEGFAVLTGLMYLGQIKADHVRRDQRPLPDARGEHGPGQGDLLLVLHAVPERCGQDVHQVAPRGRGGGLPGGRIRQAATTTCTASAWSGWTRPGAAWAGTPSSPSGWPPARRRRSTSSRCTTTTTPPPSAR